MATLEKAIALAAMAHAGQLDKYGQPYILHPLAVMAQFTDPGYQMVAVLHDVIEDTDITMGDLDAAGFDHSITADVFRLSRSKQETYRAYILRVSEHERPRKVKIADLRHNMEPTRLLWDDDFQSDSRRMHKYVVAYRFLTGQMDAAVFVDRMKRLEEWYQAGREKPCES